MLVLSFGVEEELEVVKLDGFLMTSDLYPCPIDTLSIIVDVLRITRYRRR